MSDAPRPGGRAARGKDPQELFDRLVGRPGEGVGGASGPREVAGPPVRRRRRKKTGKRSNPEWELVSAYMRKSTYRRVKQALMDQEPPMQVSDLLEQLCRDWLEEVGWEVEE